MHLDVRYRFFDRDSGQAGWGSALIRLDGPHNFDADDPVHRHLLEAHIARVIAQEHPQHMPGRIVVLVLDCSPAPPQQDAPP